MNGSVNGSSEDCGDGMFSRDLLTSLVWDEYADKFRPAISVTHPGDGLIVRPLQRADYDKGGTMDDCRG